MHFSESRRAPWLRSALTRLTWIMVAAVLSLTFVLVVTPTADAQSSIGTGPVTGKPLPRFVSLANEEAFMRRGPTRQHAIEWVYRRKNLPVEVVAEYGNWRKVRDFDGTIGWMNRVVLSNRRAGLVIIDGARLYKNPTSDSDAAALLQAGVVAEVARCDDGWCQLKVEDTSGWIPQSQLYGIQAGETFR